MMSQGCQHIANSPSAADVQGRRLPPIKSSNARLPSTLTLYFTLKKHTNELRTSYFLSRLKTTSAVGTNTVNTNSQAHMYHVK